MTAAQALLGLRPMLTPEEARAWLEDSRGGFDETVNDPWAWGQCRGNTLREGVFNLEANCRG